MSELKQLALSTFTDMPASNEVRAALHTLAVPCQHSGPIPLCCMPLSPQTAKRRVAQVHGHGLGYSEGGPTVSACSVTATLKRSQAPCVCRPPAVDLTRTRCRPDAYLTCRRAPGVPTCPWRADAVLTCCCARDEYLTSSCAPDVQT